MSTEITPKLITIRHGQTAYAESTDHLDQNPLDLTEQGIESAKQTARELRDQLVGYDRIIIVSSPRARALGTAQVFLEELGQEFITQANIDTEIRQVDAIEDIRFKDSGAFFAYDKIHSTPIYGEMWYNDPVLASENDMAEARTDVSHRSMRFLYHYLTYIKRVARECGENVCVIAFTHQEIGTNYIMPLYENEERFPNENAAVLGNAEPVVLDIINEPDTPIDQHNIRIRARGLEAKAVLVDNNLSVQVES